MDEAPTPNTTSRLGLDPFSVSTISILACGAISVWGLVSPDSLSASAQAFTGYGLRSFDWFFLGSCTLFLLIVGGLALSRAGDLKLGKDDDEPEFSTVSWLAMLFAGGMGAGLVFWGAAEPLKSAPATKDGRRLNRRRKPTAKSARNPRRKGVAAPR